jgi:hypothetical protein
MTTKELTMDGGRATETECITKAAILINGEPFSVDPPGRHSDVIRSYAKGPDGKPRRFPQSSAVFGFMTDTGRFVDREEAHTIAKAAGQIVRRCGGDEGTLYSENLW